MTPTLQELFHTTAVAAYDRQLHLADRVEGLDWHLDVPDAQLSFGDRYQWNVQFLGSASEVSGAWLWAWANSGLPRQGLTSVAALRKMGMRDSIPELMEPAVSLSESSDVSGHALAALASGLCRSNAYYRCPSDGGAFFVLIQDATYPQAEFDPVRRIAAVFPQALAALPLSDHRLAWTGYLASYGLSAIVEGDTLVVPCGQAELRAVFDERNRLTQLESHFTI